MDDDVVTLIKADHRAIERLFDQLKRFDEEAEQPDAGERGQLFEQVCALITAHNRAEEQQVFPAMVHEAAEDVEVAQSRREHAEVDEMIAELREAGLDAPDFPQRLDQLIAAVEHHVGEEEAVLLPSLVEVVDDERLAELAEDFLDCRQQELDVLAVEGVPAPDEPPPEQAAPAQPEGRKGRK